MSGKKKPRRMKTIPSNAMNAWRRAALVEGKNPDLYRWTPEHVIVYIRGYRRTDTRGGWTLRRNGEIIALSTVRARRAGR